MNLTYAPELHELYDKHKFNLPSLKTAQGAALAWLSQPNMRGGNGWVDRDGCEDFFRKHGISSKDAIQPFNKPGGQYLLDKIDVKGKYSLKFPFEFKDLYKRRDVKMNVLVNGSKEEQVKSVKAFHFEIAKRHMKDAEMFFQLYRLEHKQNVYDRLMGEIHKIKEIHDTIICMPIEKWQIGHLDATKGNNPYNLYYQPPIQSKYRDNYIFNPMFQKIKVKD